VGFCFCFHGQKKFQSYKLKAKRGGFQNNKMNQQTTMCVPAKSHFVNSVTVIGSFMKYFVRTDEQGTPMIVVPDMTSPLGTNLPDECLEVKKNECSKKRKPYQNSVPSQRKKRLGTTRNPHDGSSELE
jgi:C1A family cysteine protease